MTYAVPTAPVTGHASYDEYDDHYEQVVGTSAGAITTITGQVLARANVGAYWDILNCLFMRGYTAAQITLWMAGEGKIIHQYLGVFYWASDLGIARDHAVFADAERYRKRWIEICKNGAAIFDATGEFLDPTLDAGAAARQQALSSSRNNTAAALHNFDFDRSPRQFHAGTASERVADSRYPNTRGGL